MADIDLLLAQLGTRAEEKAYSEPNLALVQLRQFCEICTQLLFRYHNEEWPPGSGLNENVGLLGRNGWIPPTELDYLQHLRRRGNDAAHAPHYGSPDEAIQTIDWAHRIGAWLVRSLRNPHFHPPAFVKPPHPSERYRIDSVRYTQRHYVERFVGRGAVLADLWDWLEDEGSQPVRVIIAPPGMGKSWLLGACPSNRRAG